VGYGAKLRHIVAEVQRAGASAEAERLLTIKSFMLKFTFPGSSIFYFNFIKLSVILTN